VMRYQLRYVREATAGCRGACGTVSDA
jgi:hypothetical protein